MFSGFRILLITGIRFSLRVDCKTLPQASCVSIPDLQAFSHGEVKRIALQIKEHVYVCILTLLQIGAKRHMVYFKCL